MLPISDKLISELNLQVGREMGNSFLYRNFSSWCHVRGLKNLEKFFLGESDGEVEHSKIFQDLLNKANAVIEFPAIEQKPRGFGDFTEISRTYIEAEAETTDHLQDIYDMAEEEQCVGVSNVLQSMLEEQIEEEGLANKVSQLSAQANGNLLLLDLMFSD